LDWRFWGLFQYPPSFQFKYIGLLCVVPCMYFVKLYFCLLLPGEWPYQGLEVSLSGVYFNLFISREPPTALSVALCASEPPLQNVREEKGKDNQIGASGATLSSASLVHCRGTSSVLIRSTITLPTSNRRRQDDKCWFCRTNAGCPDLRCPSERLGAAKVEAWEGKDPGGVSQPQVGEAFSQVSGPDPLQIFRCESALLFGPAHSLSGVQVRARITTTNAMDR